MIHTNNAAVISLLKDDACFIQELFSRMGSPNISMESKRELVRHSLIFSYTSLWLHHMKYLFHYHICLLLYELMASSHEVSFSLSDLFIDRHYYQFLRIVSLLQRNLVWVL
ncbi:hypothetical protein VPH35_001466 [Triticum aestivum]|uniref:Uncharacterized protein n=1 Tax=Triticum turgidum subsp. durum TaxID=4567 RepID=A0A9R0Q102_TRITD|nr:unnamed protein product [Triticum turgidum subsp. durum]